MIPLLYEQQELIQILSGAIEHENNSLELGSIYSNRTIITIGLKYVGLIIPLNLGKEINMFLIVYHNLR